MNPTSTSFLPDIHINALSIAKKNWPIMLFYWGIFFIYHKVSGKWEIILLIPFVVSVMDIIRQFFIPFRMISVEFDDVSNKLFVHYKPRMHPEVSMKISYQRLNVKVYQRKGWWTKKLKQHPYKIVLLSGKTEMIDLDESKGFSGPLLTEVAKSLTNITSQIRFQ